MPAWEDRILEGRHGRSYRLSMAAVAGLLLIVFGAFAVLGWAVIAANGRYGGDLEIMVELGRRWLATGSMYMDYQLVGPYSTAITSDLTRTPGLYPPPAGPVFAALGVLPWPLLAIAWWSLPIIVVAWFVRSTRPAPWAWPAMAACLAWPFSAMIIIAGGTAMWAAVIVVAGLRYRWPAALILLKPTLLPFSLIGIRHVGWWAIAGVIGVLYAIGPGADYLVIARNASGLDYVFNSYPLICIPLVAWVGRRRGERV